MVLRLGKERGSDGKVDDSVVEDPTLLLPVTICGEAKSFGVMRLWIGSVIFCYGGAKHSIRIHSWDVSGTFKLHMTLSIRNPEQWFYIESGGISDGGN